MNNKLLVIAIILTTPLFEGESFASEGFASENAGTSGKKSMGSSFDAPIMIEHVGAMGRCRISYPDGSYEHQFNPSCPECQAASQPCKDSLK